ncbi:hypothetical protein EGR_09956 [Echinococcus granulosus]|uniref:Uncharacterized protein n=1 Tax=Echinococcus granulosus TaxID=6210 RepID=W6U2A3_ECHGR|nr:hypothetical protein EGR_09956 [Echinococcus granulosus]EUB55193.1 hypothetical protein EGR_09956 [Echinococcus granulosus]
MLWKYKDKKSKSNSNWIIVVTIFQPLNLLILESTSEFEGLQTQTFHSPIPEMWSSRLILCNLRRIRYAKCKAQNIIIRLIKKHKGEERNLKNTPASGKHNSIVTSALVMMTAKNHIFCKNFHAVMRGDKWIRETAVSKQRKTTEHTETKLHSQRVSNVKKDNTIITTAGIIKASFATRLINYKYLTYTLCDETNLISTTLSFLLLTHREKYNRRKTKKTDNKTTFEAEVLIKNDFWLPLIWAFKQVNKCEKNITRLLKACPNFVLSFCQSSPPQSTSTTGYLTLNNLAINTSLSLPTSANCFPFPSLLLYFQIRARNITVNNHVGFFQSHFWLRFFKSYLATVYRLRIAIVMQLIQTVSYFFSLRIHLYRRHAFAIFRDGVNKKQCLIVVFTNVAHRRLSFIAMEE